MIISHRHRFIFLSTVATGATSVEIALSRYCGGEDVLTPLSPTGEPVRRELGITPRNYLAPRAAYTLPDYYRLLVEHEEKRQYRNHGTASEIRDRIGADIWNSYFKFTIERNPWDKTIADYHSRAGRGGPESLDTYFRAYRGKFKHFNYPRYSLDGRPAVDAIVRFENLVPDLTAVLARVGITYDGWLPGDQESTSVNSRHYSQVLTSDQQQFVADHFHSEINLLGYRFATASPSDRAAA